MLREGFKNPILITYIFGRNYILRTMRFIIKEALANFNLAIFMLYLALPCAATDSIAFLTVSSSPRNFIETTGFMSVSNS